MNVRLGLSADEANRLVAAGTKLVTILTAFSHLKIDGEVFDDEPLISWANEVTAIEDKAKSESEPRAQNFWSNVAKHARHLKPGDGLFAIDGKCGFLQDDDRCGDYENRPRICQVFQMGGDACMGFRQRAGVDVPLELTSKPEQPRIS
jgi:hypothetical protein